MVVLTTILGTIACVIGGIVMLGIIGFAIGLIFEFFGM